MTTSTSSWRARTAMLAATVLALAAVTASFGSGGASAKGGTAKPPAGNPAPLTPPIWPAVPAPTFTANTAGLHGFDVTGFIQSASVDPTLCPGAPASNVGGTIVLNGVTITVPCNSVIQMPANTLSWPDAIDIATHNALALDGTGSGTAAAPNTPYPSFEAHVVGNIVADAAGASKYIAGLVFLSQQSVNSGQGVVTAVNFADGSLTVAPAATGGVGKTVRVQINDPNKRFSIGQSPDPRFSVDDANATIHSGTGYPMCIPRSASDALCPQKNRPKSTATTSCRNWTIAGVALPAAGELPVTPVGEFCRNYVMKDPSGTLTAADADSRQQAPIEVGDFVSYQGTLFKGATGQPDYISAHTIEVNVGLYTQPGSIPSYVAIGEFGVGSADPSLVSVNGANQETQDRIFIETETTDPKSPMDIYMVDVDPATGQEYNRFITPFEMTGESNGPFVYNATAVPPALSTTTVVGGGITTANAGAQVQRDRLRATKAPVGVLGSPTRYIRAVSRNTCMPNKYLLNGLQASFTVPTIGVSTAANTVLPNIQVPAIDVPVAAGGLRTAGTCLDSVKFANGLRSGSYTAPTFEFIFPENVSVGDPVVPNDFWHLGFLVNGEGPGTGPLTPQPW